MSNSPTSSDDIFHHFVSTPLDKLLAEHQSINLEAKVLALFHRCIAEVPTYRRFLEVHSI
jgi:phenylacetate-CoA ligase